MKGFNTLFIVLALAGCSSPPEPPVVDWSAPAHAMNTTLPAWNETAGVVHVPAITGHWRKTISFADASQEQPLGVWYAIAHSTAITVESPDGTRFREAQVWLQRHGATGAIHYAPLDNSLTRQTRITLTR